MVKMQTAEPARFRLTAFDREVLPLCVHDIDLWARAYFDGQMFPYQRQFYHRPQKDKLLIAGIRTGKSKMCSRGFLHFGQYHPYARLLNTSISSEQAKIVYQQCLEDCHAPRFRHWVEHVQSSPYPLIRLVNGAELWFRSIGYDAELIRGFEFDLINVDEAAYVVRESAIKTLKGRLLGINPFTQAPRLGLFWMMSSPKGQGWLAERWKQGDPGYSFAKPERYLSLRATIWDNPLLDQEQIAELMADYTDAMIRQELYGEFLDLEDAVFPYSQVMAACDPESREVRFLYEQITAWKARHSENKRSIREDAGLTEDITHYECEPAAGHRYVSSWDLGKKPTKAGRNACVGMVYDITHEPWSQVAFLYREGMGYVEAKSHIERWHEKYQSRGSLCQTVIDSTGKGDVLQEFLEREGNIERLEGIVYSSTQKPNLIHAGKIMLERGSARFPFIRRQVDQLSSYQIFDKDLVQDIVMTFCQAMYAGRELVRISERPKNLTRTLTAMPTYSARLAQNRLANPRYVQTRRGTRSGRSDMLASRKLRARA